MIAAIILILISIIGGYLSLTLMDKYPKATNFLSVVAFIIGVVGIFMFVYHIFDYPNFMNEPYITFI